MKAILYTKGGRANAACVEVPDPVVRDNDVLVRVYASCICKPADCAHDGGYSVFGKYPLIPGHEYAGIVEAVGKNVTRFKVGDRVTADANMPCGKCYYCIRGEERFCENNTPYGQKRNGGFAQLVAVEESVVYHVPDGLSLRAASMTELIGCTYNCMEVADIHYGDEILVLGCGASGSVIAQLAKNSNAATVVAIDCVQSKLDLAAKYGIETVLADKNDFSKHEAILKERYPRGFDIVIDATSDSALITSSMKLVKKRGKFIAYSFVNNTDQVKPVELDTRMFVTGELKFLGSNFQHFRFPQTLKSMEKSKVDCESIITKILPLEDYFEGMDLVWNDPDTIKVMLEPNGSSEGL